MMTYTAQKELLDFGHKTLMRNMPTLTTSKRKADRGLHLWRLGVNFREEVQLNS